MRGSPLFRVLLVVVLWTALLYPLRRLTNRHREPAVTAAPVAAEAESNVHLVLTSTSSPFHFEISHLGRTIWKGDAVETSIARDVPMAFPSQGIDLLIDAKWQDGKEGAVRLDVTANNGDPLQKTLWGTGGVNGVLTFTKP